MGPAGDGSVARVPSRRYHRYAHTGAAQPGCSELGQCGSYVPVLSIRIDSQHGDFPEKALRVEQRGCNKSHDASPNL
jgi:hypothetical protein